jgi:hypothetical protein
MTMTQRTARIALALFLTFGLLQGCPTESEGERDGEDGAPATTTFSKSYGGFGADIPHAVRGTRDGGIVLVGHAGASLSDGGNWIGGDLWISKLDANGNVEQQHVLGMVPTGTLGTQFSQVRALPDGGYVAVGSAGGVQVTRFDAAGTVLWSRVHESGPWLNYEFDSTALGAIDIGRDVWPLPDGGFWVVADSYARLRDTRDIGFDGPRNRSDVFADARSIVVMRLNAAGDVVNLRRLTEHAFGFYERDESRVGGSNLDFPIIRATADGGAVVARRKDFTDIPADGDSSRESFTLVQRLFGDGTVRWTHRIDDALYPADLFESPVSGDILFAGNETISRIREPLGCAHAVALTASGDEIWANEYDCDDAVFDVYEDCNGSPTPSCVYLLGGKRSSPEGGVRGLVRTVFAPDGTDIADLLIADPGVLRVVQLSRGEANEPLHALGLGGDGGVATILRLSRSLTLISSQPIDATVSGAMQLDETPDSRVMVYSEDSQRLTRASFTGEVETEFLLGAAGPRTDRGLAVVESAPGRFIVAGDSGSFAETAGNREGQRDAWVARFDAATGRIDWQARFAGAGTLVSTVAAAQDGGVVLGGRFDRELRAVKLSAAGELSWRSPPLNEGPLSDGYARTLHDVQSTPDRGFAALVSKGDLFEMFAAVVTKLDGDGALSWQRQYRISAAGSIEPIDSDADGSRDDGFVIGGGALTSFGIASAMKIDPAGNVVWSRDYHPATLTRTEGRSIGPARLRQAPDGGFVIAVTELGVFNTIDEDLQPQPYGQSNILLLKIDAAGEPQWLRIYGALYDETVEDLDVLPDGIILVSGRSDSFGEQDAWLLKLGPDGLISSAGCNAYLGSLSAEMIGGSSYDPTGAEFLDLPPRDPDTQPAPPLALADTMAPQRTPTSDTARQCLGSANAAVPPATPVQRYRLTVRQVGSIAGPVTSTPSGIACGTGLGDAFCSADFRAGTRITLRADVTGFRRWETACDEGTGGASEVCVITLAADRTVDVIFGTPPTEPPPTNTATLSVQIQGGPTEAAVQSLEPGILCTTAAGADCSETYTIGTVVRLNPTPSTLPVTWQGCDALLDVRICEITVAANRSVTVTFAP